MNERFNINDINKIVDDIANSRYQHIDYKLIYRISKQILEKFDIQSFDVDQPTIAVSKENTINLALQFFKSIDKKFYNQAKSIIENKNKTTTINFQVISGLSNNYNSRKQSEGIVTKKKNKQFINIPLTTTIEDVYKIVHEISHTFDMPAKLNTSRIMFADVLSESFEKMLDTYLLNNNEINEDVLKLKKQSFDKTYFLTLDYFIKYEFFDYKNKHRKLTKENVEEIIEKLAKKLNLSKPIILEYLNDHSQDISYSSRYVVGGVISEQYATQYNSSPVESIKKLKQYIKLIKKDKGFKALEKLGVQIDYENLNSILEQMNNENSNLIAKLSTKKSAVLKSWELPIDKKTEIQQGQLKITKNTSKQYVNSSTEKPKEVFDND